MVRLLLVSYAPVTMTFLAHRRTRVNPLSLACCVVLSSVLCGVADYAPASAPNGHMSPRRQEPFLSVDCRFLVVVHWLVHLVSSFIDCIPPHPLPPNTTGDGGGVFGSIHAGRILGSGH